MLNFALTLEYLEDEFYRTALSSGFIPGQFTEVFGTISRHESEHVMTLTGALGGAAVAKPRFDFTAGGNIPIYSVTSVPLRWCPKHWKRPMLLPTRVRRAN